MAKKKGNNSAKKKTACECAESLPTETADACGAISDPGENVPLPTKKSLFWDGWKKRLKKIGSAVTSRGMWLFCRICDIGKAYRKGTASCRDRWCPRLPLWAVDTAAAVLSVAVTAGVIFAVSLSLPRDAFAFVREGELFFAAANGREISLGAIGDKEPYLNFSEDGKRAARVMQDESLVLFSSRGRTKIIAEGVSRFCADPSLRFFVYEKNGALFTNGDEAAFADGVREWAADKECGRTAYLTHTGELFLHLRQGGTKKLADGVSRLASVDENGAVHYLKIANESFSVLSFFSDPNKAADDAMTEPVKPTLPESIPAPQPVFRSQFATEEEYLAALSSWNSECDRVREENHRANEVYNAAVRLYNTEAEAWNERVKRESLRHTLGEIPRAAQRVTYCRWQGEEEMPFGEVIVLNRAFRWDVSATGVVLFSYCSPASSLTLEANADAEAHLLRLDTLDIRQSTVCCLTGEGGVVTLPIVADEFTLSPSGECLYGYTDADGDGVGELSRLYLSESDVISLGSVKEGSLTFSRDGKCLWIAVNEGAEYLVCEGKAYAGISQAQFTLRSRITALRDENGEGTLVLIDGKRERKLQNASWLPSLL